VEYIHALFLFLLIWKDADLENKLFILPD